MGLFDLNLLVAWRITAFRRMMPLHKTLLSEAGQFGIMHREEFYTSTLCFFLSQNKKKLRKQQLYWWID
jgi:hypothetical protein